MGVDIEGKHRGKTRQQLLKELDALQVQVAELKEAVVREQVGRGGAEARRTCSGSNHRGDARWCYAGRHEGRDNLRK